MLTITVFNPAPGGGLSGAASLPVNNPTLFPTTPVLKADAFAVYTGPSVSFQLVW